MLRARTTVLATALVALSALPAAADARNHLDAALAAAHEGELDRAAEEAARVPEGDPWRADARFCLGWSFARIDQHEKAVEAYREVVKLREQDARAWNNLGASLDELGRFAEAVAAYDRAIAPKPSYAAAYNNKGVSLEKMGEGERAADMFRRAIDFQPDYAAAHNNLGAWYYELGDRAAASKEWAEAARLDPSYVSPIVNVSVLDFEGEREGVAEISLRTLVETGRATAEVHFNLGIFAFRRGDHQAAVQQMQKADDLRPDHPETLNNLGVLHYFLGNHRRAETTLRRATELSPKMAKAWDNLGLVLYRMERYPEARAAFEKEVAVAPEGSFGHYNLGCALAAENQTELAAKSFERAVQIAPGNLEAIHNLAVLLASMKERDPRREVALYEQALRVDPTYAAAHLSLGQFYQSEPSFRDVDKAIHHYQEFCRHEPKDIAMVDQVMRTIAALRRTKM